MVAPCLEEQVVWELWPADGWLGPLGFGDGSLLQGRVPRLARAGWGIVVLDAGRREMARLHGPVPGWHQDITMAECMALMWYVRLVSADGGTFHTVCLNLVRMWERGEAH